MRYETEAEAVEAGTRARAQYNLVNQTEIEVYLSSTGEGTWTWHLELGKVKLRLADDRTGKESWYAVDESAKPTHTARGTTPVDALDALFCELERREVQLRARRYYVGSLLGRISR